MTEIKLPLRYGINKDTSRNELFTEFGKEVLKDRYLIEGEDFQDIFERVSCYYADDQEHAQRMYDYMSMMWMMPSTPVLSNGGTSRGLPISCFLNEVSDSLNGIVETWNENVWLASGGGGIGTYWGDVRSISEKVRGGGSTTGIVPFIGVQDKLTLAVSQGNLRRGSAAIYLPVWHPEIEEFIDIRKPTGGDYNRKALNLHHGVVISDEFMRAVENNDKWDLLSPKDQSVILTVNARDIWIRILTTRIETGEPYLYFIDTVNRNMPEIYKKLNMAVKTSNLCNEITLTTGADYMGKTRTAVCCLSSVNLEYFDQWKGNDLFIADIMRFLDNVMSDFIKRAPKEQAKAVYSATRERSVGLGVMGFHSLLQQKDIPMESVVAKSLNKRVFAHLRSEADAASKVIAEEKGACPDAAAAGMNERFVHKMAIAPTASISIIAGNSSPGIEPYSANAYTQKTLTGSFLVKNKYLKKLLQSKSQDTDEVWSGIMNNEGSVLGLDFLSQHEKDVFKTAFEINQAYLIDFAADRAEYIDQGQSLNIFLLADVSKKELHTLHYNAWRKGVKGMYYLRSKSLQRADAVSVVDNTVDPEQLELNITTQDSGDECLACQ